jgi:hypothetical protein
MIVLAIFLSLPFLRANIWSLIFEPSHSLIFAFAASREPCRHLRPLTLPTQVVLFELKVYVYFLEEVFAECMLDARAECWRDASDDVPKVGKVGMIAEDVDPHLSR